MSRVMLILLAAAIGCTDTTPPTERPSPTDPPSAPAVTVTDASPVPPAAGVDRGAGNVILETPAHGSMVATNPVTVAGRARTFENHVGIRLEDQRGHLMKEAYATATGEIGEFNPFSTEVFITSAPGETMRVTIFETSAKDGSIRSRDAAVVLVTAPRRTMRLYFPNQRTGGEDCTVVRPVVRTLPASLSAARLAMEALVDGPTSAERVAGFMNPFPAGSAVRSVNLANGVLTVDLNERLVNVGGSCRVQAIRAAIDSTLRELDGIDRVVITAMGSEGQALQP
ncbi:MAG: Gmad2 immunoglobulin-like domain-containing protein [Thermoanaerobaculia bacterium]